MKRVLLVDDDADLLHAIGETLADAGYAVGAARDGADALGRLRTAGPWDVVVLDLQMPVMDGWELLAAMERSESLRDVPVVVCTGLDGRRAPDGFPVLVKPMAERDLLRAVARCVG
jgi:CheY-like chemotaxis protein